MQKLIQGDLHLKSAKETTPWGASTWQPHELDEVVGMLRQEFPDKNYKEIAQAVIFCQGVVCRNQTAAALQSFAGSLVREPEVPGAEGESAAYRSPTIWV